MNIRFEQVVKNLEKIEPDYTGLELYAYIRENYRAYCPKCKVSISFDEEHRSNMDYLGACLDCDEDFYAVECSYKQD